MMRDVVEEWKSSWQAHLLIRTSTIYRRICRQVTAGPGIDDSDQYMTALKRDTYIRGNHHASLLD